jgi:integrase
LSDPPTGICLLNLLKACGRDWIGLRDAALLRVAYDTACRRSELVALRVEHFSREADGSGLLLIPSSKTDQEGQGSTRYLWPETVAAIQRWIEGAKLGGQGPLFRRVMTDFEGNPIQIPTTALNADSISDILSRAVWRAQRKGVLGLADSEVRAWLKAASSHSFRVGKIQDHIAAGDSETPIAQAYAMRDPKTVRRYGARLAPRSGVVAKLREKVGEG